MAHFFRQRQAGAVTWSVLGLGFFLCFCGGSGDAANVEKFDGAPYEPSGLVQLSPGLILSIGDESEYPFDLVEFDTKDGPVAKRLVPSVTLSDLEGLTMDAAGNIYAITSHSVNREGESKPDREKLARFRIVDGQIDDIKVIEDIRQFIPHSAQLQASFLKKVKVDRVQVDGFNIEALAWNASLGSLLIGLRSPLNDLDEAVVLSVRNPDQAFAAAAPPDIREEATIDLQGNGFRAMEYDDELAGFLIVAGPTGEVGQFGLWLWKPEAGKLQKLLAPAFEQLQQPEGICRMDLAGQAHLLIVSDDGKIDKSYYESLPSEEHENNSESGSYLILDYEDITSE